MAANAPPEMGILCSPLRLPGLLRAEPSALSAMGHPLIPGLRLEAKATTFLPEGKSSIATEPYGD